MKRSDLTEQHTMICTKISIISFWYLFLFYGKEVESYQRSISLSFSLISFSHSLSHSLLHSIFFMRQSSQNTHSIVIHILLAGWLPPQTCKKAASSLTLSHTHTSQHQQQQQLVVQPETFFLCLCIFFTSCPERVLRIRTSLSLSRSLTQTDRRNRYRKTFFAITLVENHVLRVVGSNPTTAYWMDEFLHTGWTIFRMYLVLKIVITLFEKTKIKENRLGETISSAVKLRLDFDASFEAQNWHHQVEKLRFLHK